MFNCRILPFDGYSHSRYVRHGELLQNHFPESIRESGKPTQFQRVLLLSKGEGLAGLQRSNPEHVP